MSLETTYNGPGHGSVILCFLTKLQVVDRPCQVSSNSLVAMHTTQTCQQENHHRTNGVMGHVTPQLLIFLLKLSRSLCTTSAEYARSCFGMLPILAQQPREKGLYHLPSDGLHVATYLPFVLLVESTMSAPASGDASQMTV